MSIFSEQFLLLVIACTFSTCWAFTATPNWNNLESRRISIYSYLSASDKPILVVGATGRVGRLVVQKLLGQNRPVRALVRSRSKAQSIFGTRDSLQYPPIEIIQADLGRIEDFSDILEKAVNGCDAVISVSGGIRFSKISDFLPWRLLGGTDVSTWAGRDHPYYVNYLAQKKLIGLAEKYQVKRFVRLTGLGLAYSEWNPFKILFNVLLSMNSRYGLLCEADLAKSKVPYVVLRPGGLATDERETETTNVQVEPSGKLPFPGRIGRRDVAELAVASCDLPVSKSYTLACRWCGDGVKPKPQGSKEDGFATAMLCLQHVAESSAVALPPPKMKLYALPVAIAVYSFAFSLLKIIRALLKLSFKIVKG